MTKTLCGFVLRSRKKKCDRDMSDLVSLELESGRIGVTLIYVIFSSSDVPELTREGQRSPTNFAMKFRMVNEYSTVNSTVQSNFAK